MNESSRTFACSPLLFLRSKQHGATVIEVVSGSAFEALSPTGARLIEFAIEPRTFSEAEAAGFSHEELQAGFTEGLIVWTDDQRYQSSELWQNANWSRAAYALFSQFNLTYAENTWQAETLDEHVSGRRAMIETYIAEEPYPDKFWIEPAGEPIVLPRPQEKMLELRLDRLWNRRSVRSFSRRPLTLEELSVVLFGASSNIRLAQDSQAQGDAFFILNSFYSWLSIFVAIQGVDALPRGIYQYDGELHRLLPTGRLASDKEIAASIANQNWIQGNGFCLYVVVDWIRYMWIYRHARAYINLLTQIGEFSQEVIQYASNCGLGGWMTPAVDEEVTGEMLGLDQTRCDAMLFMKIGEPAKKQPMG